jgi:MFS transporter, SP family, sugar:H+ symporter
MTGVLILPESPRYLLGKQRVEDARRAISVLNDCPIDSKLVSETMLELEEAIREENDVWILSLRVKTNKLTVV